MSILVVDTDLVSYVFKAHPLADAFLEILEGNELIISFTTRAELGLGARLANWGPRRIAALERHLARYGVCFSDERLCDLWAEVMLDGMRRGFPVNSQDAWIAGTALYLDAPLVTNNVRHFGRVSGLRILHPAQS